MIDVLMCKLGSPLLPGQRSRTKIHLSLQNNLEARTCVLSCMQRWTGTAAEHAMRSKKQAAGDREYQGQKHGIHGAAAYSTLQQ